MGLISQDQQTHPNVCKRLFWDLCSEMFGRNSDCSSDSLDQEQNKSHFISQSTINIRFSCCYIDDDLLANSFSQ